VVKVKLVRGSLHSRQAKAESLVINSVGIALRWVNTPIQTVYRALPDAIDTRLSALTWRLWGSLPLAQRTDAQNCTELSADTSPLTQNRIRGNALTLWIWFLITVYS